MFRVLPPTIQTRLATNQVVASCVNTDFWLDKTMQESRPALLNSFCSNIRKQVACFCYPFSCTLYQDLMVKPAGCQLIILGHFFLTTWVCEKGKKWYHLIFCQKKKTLPFPPFSLAHCTRLLSSSKRNQCLPNIPLLMLTVCHGMVLLCFRNNNYNVDGYLHPLWPCFLKFKF